VKPSITVLDNFRDGSELSMDVFNSGKHHCIAMLDLFSGLLRGSSVMVTETCLQFHNVLSTHPVLM
jgi:hypothetical protein